LESKTWRDVEGFDGIYQVSSTGEVRSRFKRGARKNLLGDGAFCTLKPSHTRNGYSIVHLYNGTSRRTLQIHTLVADAFIPKADGRPIVNHINGDKADNRVENLERVTARENSIHAYRMGLTPKPPIKRKLNDQEVLEIFRQTGPMSENASLAERFGVDKSVIWRIRNGHRYGYITGA